MGSFKGRDPGKNGQSFWIFGNISLALGGGHRFGGKNDGRMHKICNGNQKISIIKKKKKKKAEDMKRCIKKYM